MTCEDCETHECGNCIYEQNDYDKEPCKECVNIYKLGELPNWIRRD